MQLKTNNVLSHRHALLFFLIVIVIGLSLRLTYLNWGLPYIHHPDEPINLSIVHRMVKQADLNPRAFFYPSLLYYAALPGQFIVRAMDGQLAEFSMQSMGTGWLRQPASLLAARITIVIVGLALIAAVILWVVRVFETPWLGVLTGTLVAFNPILVRHSTYFTPDQLSALFATLALFGASLIVMRGQRWNYMFAGVMAGLAASSKYNAGLVAVAIAVAHWQRCGFKIRHAAPLFVAALASCAALLITSPFLLLDMDSAHRGIASVLTHYSSGHGGAEGDSLAYKATWLFQLTGATGIAIAGLLLDSRARPLLPAAVFSVLYFLLLASQEVRFERNIMPIIPAILVLAAGGLYVIVGRPSTPALRAVAVGLFLLAYVGPLSRTVSGLASSEQDDRAGARVWLQRLLPRDATVAVEAYAPYLTGFTRLRPLGSRLALNSDSR